MHIVIHIGMLTLVTLSRLPACTDFSNGDVPAVAIAGHEGPSLDIGATGMYVYVQQGESGVYVVDRSDPAEPVVVAEFGLGGGVTSIEVAGDRLMASCGLEGVRIYSLNPPFGLEYRSTLQTGSYVFRSHLWGDSLFTGSTAGVDLFTVADPLAPQHRWHVDTPQDALDFARNGPWLLVASAAAGISVIDLGTPSLVSNLPLPGFTVSIDTDAGIGVLATNTGVRILDLANLPTVQTIGVIPLAGGTHQVLLRGPHLYVKQTHRCLVYDIGDPFAPSWIGATDSLEFANRIAVEEDWLLISNSAIGLQFRPRQCLPIPLTIRIHGPNLYLDWQDSYSASWRVLGSQLPWVPAEDWTLRGVTNQPSWVETGWGAKPRWFYRVVPDSGP